MVWWTPSAAREVVERRVGRDRACRPVDSFGGRVGQEHDAGLRAQLDDVARAIVFLVAARALVLLDDVALVFVDREAAGDAGLLVLAHPQPIEVERRRLVRDERRLLAERREILARPLVDRAASTGSASAGRSISDRVTCRKLSGLPAAS